MRDRILSMLLFFSLVVILCGCGGVDGAEKKEDTSEQRFQITVSENQTLKWDYTDSADLPELPGARIAFVLKNMDLDYWNAVREGAEQAVREFNEQHGYEGEDAVSLTFEGTSDGADVEGQVNQIDAILSENPTAMCISAVDVASCQPQLEAAVDNGIPVLALDSGVDSPLIAATCATDNDAASRVATQKLCEAIGDEGKIAIVSHTATSKTAIERVNGFRWELSDHPGVTVAANLVENEVETIETMLQTTLEVHPDLEGIFCTNEQTANEVLDALGKLERKDVSVVGFDAGKTQREAIEDGNEYGLICQNPRGMGYVSVTAAIRAAADQEIDQHIDTGFRWIDMETMNLEENQLFLY